MVGRRFRIDETKYGSQRVRSGVLEINVGRVGNDLA